MLIDNKPTKEKPAISLLRVFPCYLFLDPVTEKDPFFPGVQLSLVLYITVLVIGVEKIHIYFDFKRINHEF